MAESDPVFGTTNYHVITSSLPVNRVHKMPMAPNWHLALDISAYESMFVDVYANIFEVNTDLSNRVTKYSKSIIVFKEAKLISTKVITGYLLQKSCSLVDKLLNHEVQAGRKPSDRLEEAYSFVKSFNLSRFSQESEPLILSSDFNRHLEYMKSRVKKAEREARPEKSLFSYPNRGDTWVYDSVAVYLFLKSIHDLFNFSVTTKMRDVIMNFALYTAFRGAGLGVDIQETYKTVMENMFREFDEEVDRLFFIGEGIPDREIMKNAG